MRTSLLSSQTPLELLRTRIRALEQPTRRSHGVLAFGIAPIDARLPEGGLALGALHEIRGGGPAGAAAIAAATLFSAGLLARTEGSVLWCHIAPDLFPPALAAVGLHPDRVIHVAVDDEKTVLLVMEEGLAQPGLGGVLGELFHLPMIASRRLALAAEKSGVLTLVLRRDEEKKMPPIAARTRWRVSPCPAPLPAWPGLRRALWRVELIRCRGVASASWKVEACDATGHLGVAAVLPDRSVAPVGGERAQA